MPDTKSPQPNIEEIIQKIQAEAARIKSESAGPAGLSLEKDKWAPALPRYPEKPSLEPKSAYHLADFLGYHDEQFIRNTYWGILGREPDARGFQYYLERLRSGAMNKVEILGRLRYSPEGRSKAKKVRGLFFPFALHTAFRIPVLGYVFHLPVALLRLPARLRDMEHVESDLNGRWMQSGRLFNQAMGDIEHHLNRSNTHLSEQLAELRHQMEALDQARAELRSQMDALDQARAELHSRMEDLDQAKADARQLAELRSQMEALDQAKADARQLAELRSRMEALDQAKADARQLAELHSRMEDLNQAKADALTLKEIHRQIQDHKRNILDQQRRLTWFLEEARKRLPEPLGQDSIRDMVNEEDHLLDAMYASFEDRFRGTRQDIKERQKVYIPYIKQAAVGTEEAPLLDVGCGRGEWLELLKEQGCVARGIDLNRVMLRQCREEGLEVSEADVLEYLRQQQPHSLGAITGFHIIEHLPLNQLIALLDEALRVLRPGGVVIFETPNPRNILVGSGDFYIDPTHRNPIFPDTLSVLSELRGFNNSQAYFFNEAYTSLTPSSSYRFETLDDYLSISRDFAWIGYKP